MGLRIVILSPNLFNRIYMDTGTSKTCLVYGPNHGLACLFKFYSYNNLHFQSSLWLLIIKVCAFLRRENLGGFGFIFIFRFFFKRKNMYFL